jgi:predicted 3-demethylubiquinone-9 3-methyltransferase (glyoxalase superfamily)
MQKITPFLWYESQAQEAAELYCSIFAGSKILSSNPMSVTFELAGQPFIALNGGPHHKFNEAISLFVSCKDQKEVDSLWKKLLAGGGEESQCGWLRDRYGLSWQVIPDRLTELLSDPDRKRAERATAAMFKMRKIDVAALERAADGE